MTLDSISSAIAIESGKVMPKTVWDGSDRILSMLGGMAGEATQKLTYDASQTYVKKYGDLHDILKTVEMREFVKLKEI